MRNQGAANNIVLHVYYCDAVFVRRKIVDHVANVVGVKSRGLRGHATWEVGVANNGNAIVGYKFLARFCQRAVAATLSGEVNDDRALLHARNHVVSPQLWRGAIRDERRGDNDIYRGRELTKFLALLVDKSLARGRRVAIGSRAVELLFIEFQENKFCSHRFDLFRDFGAHIERQRNSTE